MSRWEPGAEERLSRAAMELYSERGFDEVTVAQIAERADLTERTFFRHFGDKAEMLFGGGGHFIALFVDAIASAPPGPPLSAISLGLYAAAADFEPRRPFVLERQKIINSHTDLMERELLKLSALAAAMSAALRDRGVPEPQASLAGWTGLSVFHTSFATWVSSDGRSFESIITESLAELKVVAAG
ncbi:MAG: TetR family transcriptional regulator [Microbacteriaceae bacterium]|nr:TetR family transcriptional regulator [Microbacteriaceae bacterium]